MISLSFSEFKDYSYHDDLRFCLYVVKNNEILYIGISRDNIWNRWFRGTRCHIMTKYDGALLGTTSIGSHIVENIPDSWNWKIELWTLEDCIECCDDEIKRLGIIKERIGYGDIEILEAMMIRKFKPAYNSTHNRY